MEVAMNTLFVIQYPPVVDHMVNDLAADIERRSPYPVKIRRGGEYNVSLVIQTVIGKLVLDCPNIQRAQWARYREFYINVRPATGTRRREGQRAVYLTPETEADIAAVVAYLKTHDIAMPYVERVVRGTSYPNKPLVTALAIKHSHDQLKQ